MEAATLWSTLLLAGQWFLIVLVYAALFVILWAVRQELGARVLGTAPEAGTAAGRLRVVQGGVGSGLRPGATFSLAPVTTLGAAGNNTLTLEDPYVSGRHARLTWDGAQWWVEDLGSANGTAVNGQPCRPHARCPVPFGARLLLGDVELELLQ